MSYLKNYVESIREKKQHELADTVEKTALQVHKDFLDDYDYYTNKIGMLFGNVQSGKTAQVFGIVSKAADDSFPFFILLTTDNTLLQEQTFKRAEKDLTDFVVCDEKDEQKFKTAKHKPALLVLKKNTHILKEWSDIIKNMQSFKGNPLFIIDDEADAASLNTKVNQEEISSINNYLTQIRNTATASIYLQVTGTPQSLLLQSADTDWHPDFKYYFEPGKGYLGGDFFFPDSKKIPDSVRLVDSLPSEEAMKEVVLRHLVVTAQSFLNDGQVSNCLIHPGVKQDTHKEIKEVLKKVIRNITNEIEDDEIQGIIKREYASIYPKKTEKADINDIKIKIKTLLDDSDYNIITLNSSSDDTSEDYETGCNFIIGGNTLGRGVTFDQLNTFYYIRTSQSPQADTMWQHNRIFGYDRDSGLISLYCTSELYQLFFDINETNNDIIHQIKSKTDVTISYPSKLRPTRFNVIDKSKLNVLFGGFNRYPEDPINNTFSDITKMLERFGDSDPAEDVNLKLIIHILKKFEAEEAFNLKRYINILESILKNKPGTQGKLYVRRNRDITKGTGALLSQNDWNETNKYKDQFVLTVYQVNGKKEQKWDGSPLWVPNIKLPDDKDYYFING